MPSCRWNVLSTTRRRRSWQATYPSTPNVASTPAASWPSLRQVWRRGCTPDGARDCSAEVLVLLHERRAAGQVQAELDASKRDVQFAVGGRVCVACQSSTRSTRRHTPVALAAWAPSGSLHAMRQTQTGSTVSASTYPRVFPDFNVERQRPSLRRPDSWRAAADPSASSHWQASRSRQRRQATWARRMCCLTRAGSAVQSFASASTAPSGKWWLTPGRRLRCAAWLRRWTQRPAGPAEWFSRRLQWWV